MLLASIPSSNMRIQLRIAGAFCFVFGLLLLFFVGIHLKEDGNRVEIQSPLYIHSHGYYDRVKIIKLAGAYTVLYNIYEPNFREYYILQRQDTFELWNKYRRVLSDRGNLKVINMDFGHGPLNVIQRSDGRVFDLYGDEVRDGYHARTIDRTPPDIL